MLTRRLLAPAAARAQDPATTLHDLLVQYRCPVVDRLERIYEGGGLADAQDRFLIIDLPGRPQDWRRTAHPNAFR